MTNSLLKDYQLPYDAIAFDQIKTEDFLPAVEKAIAIAKERIEKIKHSSDEPSFENTILALETCSEELDLATSVYYNLFSAEADEDLQALSKTISPMVSAYSSDLLLDEGIFARVKAVYEGRESANLNSEQLQLLKKDYDDMVRNGALLPTDKKARLKEIDQELSKLSPEFAENVLKSTNACEWLLTDEADLAGLPDSFKASAKHAASEKGKEGWLINLDMPSYIPFTTYSENRKLREEIWRTFNNCATSGETDNREVLKKIVSLRSERAQLLGYETHCHFVLAERMAESPEKVMNFLGRIKDVSKGAAEKELAELVEFRKTQGDNEEFMPWDFSFWSEKLKQEKFKFSQEEVRPYFKLENVVAGAFDHAKKLYNLDFEELNDIPVYHEDVKVYKVTSGESFVGLFYTDFFPRKTKKNGAWMTNYRGQGLRAGEVRRPHVSIVCNFTKPTPEQPSLLTMDEVRTLFHELGHALHGLLSQCTYSAISGTNVYWDFVELPSQINENWVLEKETLSQFAKHYETGEVLPEEFMEKIKEASCFQAGYSSLRQVSFGVLDMAWHSANPNEIGDIEEFEKEITSECTVLPLIEGAMTSPRFSHIFAGGYSSGYYSYKWAEVLDADAFELFQEKGLYDKSVADSFRENILERGGTEHPMELYKKFRGREPDPDALLRRDRLI